jgi:hypothetical protein
LPRLLVSGAYKIILPTTNVAKTIAVNAGKIRLILRNQKLEKLNTPCSYSLRIIDVMRKPEITKNTSTPIKPPGSNS